MGIITDNEFVFTVITPSLNTGQLIDRCILSVQAQGMAGKIQHWVIDGGSRDVTVEKLKAFKDVQWISEPDNGLADAVNKGIERARGEWIVWLNSDDELVSGALPAFLKFREGYPNASLFCADEELIGYRGTPEGVLKGKAYNFDDLVSRDVSINQAATIVHRDVYRSIGMLDVRYRYAMDYEWTVRAAKVLPCVYWPFTFARYHMRRGSITDSGNKRQFMEYARVRRMHGLSRFSRMDFKIQWYISTDPLRRIPVVRRLVRRMKTWVGLDVPYTG